MEGWAAAGGRKPFSALPILKSCRVHCDIYQVAIFPRQRKFEISTR